MNPSTLWVAGVVSAWVGAAVIVVAGAAGQPPQTAPAAPQGEKSAQQIAFERLQRGERVMNAGCSAVGCHTVRTIQTSAMDEAGWTKTIAAMIEKGARFDPEDLPFLTEYLVRFHGPLPEGEGRAILLNICTLCHDLQRVRTHRGTVEDWFELINAMIGEGAPLTDEQIPIVLKYLATNFPPRTR